MRIYDIILKKRNGGVLSREEIKFFIEGYTKGDIPDYQASALCMAIWFRGMTTEETVALTLAIRDSADVLSFPDIKGLRVDKHSTGGVGDKTSLVVASVVASRGVKVAKMSGRGLGHTGGTVDKLEAIRGFRTDIDTAEFQRIVNEVGIAIVGQSATLAPADKLLYALRDVTATVDSLPLIASSIMGKKLAADDDCIVLDVKTGSGAFMKSLEESAAIITQPIAQFHVGCGKANVLFPRLVVHPSVGAADAQGEFLG
jgi:pyrimidine-nucleoside phosphorylase